MPGGERMRSEGNWYVEDGRLKVWCTSCGRTFDAPCSEEQERRLMTDAVQDVLPGTSDDLRNCLIGAGKCCLCELFDMTVFTEAENDEIAAGINEIIRMCGLHYHVNDAAQGYQLAIELCYGNDDASEDEKDCVFLIRHYLQDRLDRIWEEYSEELAEL